MSLNWKELELQVREIAPAMSGAVVQKIAQTGDFASGEGILLHGYSHGAGPWHCLISLRGNFTFFGLLPKEIPVDSQGSASTFVMVLRKHFVGPRIQRLEQIDGDRILRLVFEHGKSLLIELIPRRGNIIAVEDWDERERSGRSLGSFRQVSLAAGGRYTLPPSNPFEVKQVRDFTEVAGDSYAGRVVRFFCERLHSDTFEIERAAWVQAVRSAQKKIATALRNAEKDAEKAEKADGLREQAMALSEKLYELGPKSYPRAKQLTLETLAEGKTVKVALDPAYSYSENAERLFRQAKKLERANTEMSERLAGLRAKHEALEASLAAVEGAADSDELLALAGQLAKAGVGAPKAKAKAAAKKPKGAEAKEYLEVQSTDGFTILCGRNQIENRAVTFQEAAGSDVWLHLKGVPGAHVVIKAIKNKTVPLQTLLEGAQLALYYSKVRDGKKADVDYTFRKNVKPIKGTQADVTYTDNKTLYVESDVEVIKRLLRKSADEL